MPLLDVTDLLFDPDYASYLVITRRAVTIGDNGLQTVSSRVIQPQPVGVIVPQKDAPVFRGPDQQNLPRLVGVYTPFMLQGPAQKPALSPDPLPLAGPTFYLPDLVEYMGDQYIVNKVIPWGQFGAGWVYADCSSISGVDETPRREPWDE